MPEPTRDEQRNGWDAETLAAYLAQRKAETLDFAKLEAERGIRQARTETTQGYDPHSW